MSNIEQFESIKKFEGIKNFRDLENLKINCGRKHFEALKVDYSDCDSISNFKIYIEKIKEKNKNSQN